MSPFRVRLQAIQLLLATRTLLEMGGLLASLDAVVKLSVKTHLHARAVSRQRTACSDARTHSALVLGFDLQSDWL